MIRSLLLALGVLLGLAVAHPAHSQGCNVAATAMAFGSYFPYSAATDDTTSTLTVTCQYSIGVLVGYTVQMNTGGGGSFSARSMGGPGARLGYQIYMDSNRSQVWGDGTAGTSYTTDGYLLAVSTPVIKSYTAYGRMPAHEQVTPGVYGDTVTVLLTF